jgi:hypothetical protein
MTASLPAISDLRDQPEFAEIIADRVWQAWWREQGVALSEIEAMVHECMDGQDIPLSLVAHEGPDFYGCAHLIASDLDERPQYTPWVAAVWVFARFRHGLSLCRTTSGVLLRKNGMALHRETRRRPQRLLDLALSGFSPNDRRPERHRPR